MTCSSFLRNLSGILITFSLWTPPSLVAQTPRPEVPAPLSVPRPGPTNEAPYAPQPIVQGGIVIPLYPPDSPQLDARRVREAEHYNLSKSVAGRISWITNIHNPSIEVHTVEGGLNTGAAVILAAGGGHRTLNVGSESADFVPFFHQYGVSTVILRNRLRADGYDVRTNAVNDALQAIRLVRAHAQRWNIDPKRIGIMGFSAGAELSAAAAVFYPEFDRARTGGPWNDISSRPDFTVLVYPGPSPFARGARPEIPKDVPPAFIVCPGSGDRGHGILRRDAAGRCAQHRDAPLRVWPPSGRGAARRIPHGRRVGRSQRYSVWPMAGPVHRLVPRLWLPAETGPGNPRGAGIGRVGRARRQAAGQVMEDDHFLGSEGWLRPA
jgi:acetyl esterase/lipase